MTRPPHFFDTALGPRITMRASGLYMGVAPPAGPGLTEGYYMGEVIVDEQLHSVYSGGHPTLVVTDTLAPDPYSLDGKRLLATQSVSVVPSGRVTVTLEFTRPVYTELAQEFLMTKGPVATGPEPASTAFNDIAATTYTVYAGGTSLGAPGGDSVIPLAPNFGAKIVEVASTANFAVDQWVKITNPVGGEVSIVKIAEIDASEIAFYSDTLIAMEDGATIQTINDVVSLTEVTDYTIALLTGELSILETAATIDKEIWIEYKTVLTDYAGGEFWLIPGIEPIPDYSDPALVANHPSASLLGTVDATAVTFAFEKDGADLGRDFTLYAIAIDDETPTNGSLARAIGFTQIPARATVISSDSGDSRVTLTWNDVTLDGSDVSGYNVVRNPGMSFVPSIAEKLNESLIPNSTPTVEFIDQDGAPNRRPVGEVIAPINNEFYTYAIESGKTTGQWSILTVNTRVDQTEISIAEKLLSD